MTSSGNSLEYTDSPSLTKSIDPAPETNNIEALSEKEALDIIAAVGNFESKALLLAAMKPDVVYSPGDIGRLFREIQGEPPIWAGRTTSKEYCSDSFVPIGLVAREI